MENILLSINTEYHVLVITSLIKQYYSNAREYSVTVLLHTNKSNNRFKHELNFEELNAVLVMLEYDINGRQYDPVIKKTLEKILSVSYTKFIFFLEQAPVNQYLISKLSKKGTTICLAPEGTKPYIIISKSALPSRLRSTIKNYRFLKTQKLLFGLLPFVSNRNGFIKQTDEVWIHNPEKYKNLTNKKVVPIDLYTSPSQVKTASRIFNFDIKKEIPEMEGVFLYLNQWYVEFKVYDYEITMLEKLLHKFPGKKIYIKLHPNTHTFQVEKFEKMERVVLNRSTVPAELFIMSLHKSVVFSFWSAALLIKNDDCKYYWLHKLLEQQKLMDWWSIENPSEHIIEIDNLDSIVF